MPRTTAPPFRSVLAQHRIVRAAGAHDALGALVAQEAGFEAVWASGLGVSAACGLPDASLLSMSDYLDAAATIQKRLSIPVVADCDTGFGNNLNVAHMVHEYESAGVTAVCMEDKVFPKMNSFVPGAHTLVPAELFATKIQVAKKEQSSADFFLIARTEALIVGLDVGEALRRCQMYADAGADAVLVHSKARTSAQVEDFLQHWDRRCPVVVIPTTYPNWHVDEATKAGASVIIYANQGLRAYVAALRATFVALAERGSSIDLEQDLAPLSDIFALQRLSEWQEIMA